jgi:hypothetical protein
VSCLPRGREARAVTRPATVLAREQASTSTNEPRGVPAATSPSGQWVTESICLLFAGLPVLCLVCRFGFFWFGFAWRCVALLCAVCVVAPSFVSGLRAFSSVSLCENKNVFYTWFQQVSSDLPFVLMSVVDACFKPCV